MGETDMAEVMAKEDELMPEGSQGDGAEEKPRYRGTMMWRRKLNEPPRGHSHQFIITCQSTTSRQPPMSSSRLPIPKFLKTNSNKIWCFLLDKGTTELRYGEDAFPIVVSSDTDLYELKERVRRVRSNDLAHVDAARLEVWEYIPDSAKIIHPKPGELRALINSIDYSNENIVRRVPPGQMVAALIHTEYKVLIVLVPSAMHAQASAGGSGGSGQPQYSDVFIQASEHRRFNMSDLYTNQVTRRNGNIPLFVSNYRNRLERKRPVSSTDFGELAASFGPLVSKNFTDISTLTHLLTQEEPPQESSSFEVRHMLDMCFIEDRAWWDGHKETFVNGLFFFKLQSHLLKLGLESTFPKPWPFNLIVKYRRQHCPYAPKSDYSIWIHLFPRLLVEVNSTNPRRGQQFSDDHIRLLLQGSSSIRFMNLIRRSKGVTEPALLMVTYIDKDCNARRHLLFQEIGSAISSQVRQHIDT
ncbi:hypothetical protein EDB84DRAFT_1461292 [Lactarius hengduanensis]|nr:hypothetical protein EDB84DRAFT_1461292 [Lactarius hengduanensis]